MIIKFQSPFLHKHMRKHLRTVQQMLDERELAGGVGCVSPIVDHTAAWMPARLKDAATVLRYGLVTTASGASKRSTQPDIIANITQIHKGFVIAGANSRLPNTAAVWRALSCTTLRNTTKL